MQGPFRSLSRCAAALALATLAVVLPSLHTAALNTSILACAHLHAAYSYDPTVFSSSVTVTVSASTCSTGGTDTGTSGSGTVVLQEPGGALAGTAWLNHYDLFLTVGSTAVHTAFDADVVPYAVPLGAASLVQGIFDHGDTGLLQFSTGPGSGVLTERCAFNSSSSLTTCFDDAVFAVDQTTR